MEEAALPNPLIGRQKRLPHLPLWIKAFATVPSMLVKASTGLYHPRTRIDQGLTRPSGPSPSGKLLVFSTCMPAVWSPLNGVTVDGQPALLASSGELNQSPRWNV